MNWILQHIRALLRTLKELVIKPGTTLVNILSVGVALSLPVAGYGLIKSDESLSFAFEHKPHINVYLSPSANQFDIDAIMGELDFTEGIAKKTVITKTQALAAFEKSSGIDNVLEYLKENPLPTTIVITPNDDSLDSVNIEKLKNEIEKIDGIDEVQVNQEWLDRMRNIVSFASAIVSGISILVCTAIIFTLSNTIRLLISTRANEILVGKLVGATDRFVRLPFLYTGLLYGALGGLTAYGIYLTCRIGLQKSVSQLAASYQSSFSLHALTPTEIITLILGSAILGWLAARFSVAAHLHKIKPR